MKVQHLFDDPIGYLAENPAEQAVIITDPTSQHRRPILRDETLEDVQQALAVEVQKVIEDYEASVWPKTRKNIDTYEGKPVKDEAMTIPIARRDANLTHAWVVNTIFAKTPVASCKPVVYAELPYVAQEQAADPMTGEMVEQPVQKTMPTPKFAEGLSNFVEFRTANIVPFRKIVSDFVLDALKDGNSPAIIKNVYEPRYREVRSYEPKEVNSPMLGPDGGMITDPFSGQPVIKKEIILDEVTKEVLDGPANQIVHVNRFDYIQPLDEPDPQTCRWSAMRMQFSITDFRRAFSEGRFDLCREPGREVTEEEIEEIIRLETGQERDNEPKRPKLWPAKPGKLIEPWEVWLFLPVETAKGIEILNCCGTLGLKSKKLLNLYINPSRTGERPFEPLFKNQRPHEFSGISAVEDALPFQNYISLILNAWLQNMAIANTMVFKVRKTSSAHKFLNPAGSQVVKIRPGLIVPVDEDDDFKGIPMGTPIQSSMEPILFLDAQAQILGHRTEIDRGAIPSRTPASTTEQVITQARMQPAHFLDVVRGALSNVLRRYVEMEAQHNPYGVEIPFVDQREKGAMSNLLVSFPAEPITDQFAITITATAEDEAKDALFEKAVIRLKQLQTANDEALKYGAAIFSVETPPPARRFTAFLFARYERQLRDMLQSQTPRGDKDTLDEEEIQGYLKEFDEFQQQQMLAMQQQGGMNGGAPGPQGPGGVDGQLGPQGPPGAPQPTAGGPGGGGPYVQ